MSSMVRQEASTFDPCQLTVLCFTARLTSTASWGLPAEFSFQDLRHYYASLLIRHGSDIKTVQARVRHGSAITTLRYYAHLWPDADQSTRTAVGIEIKARPEATAYALRTKPDQAAETDAREAE